MGAMKFANQGTSFLAADVADTDLDLVVDDASSFPVIAVGEYFYVVLEKLDRTAFEVCKVTSVALGTNTLTVERAQGGTVAQAFAIGDYVENRVTKSTLDEFIQRDGDVVPGGMVFNGDLEFNGDVNFNKVARFFDSAEVVDGELRVKNAAGVVVATLRNLPGNRIALTSHEGPLDINTDRPGDAVTINGLTIPDPATLDDKHPLFFTNNGIITAPPSVHDSGTTYTVDAPRHNMTRGMAITFARTPSGARWMPARAIDRATAGVGIVDQVIDSDTLVVRTSGLYRGTIRTSITPQPGEILGVDDVNDGAWARDYDTSPIANPLLLCLDNNNFMVFEWWAQEGSSGNISKAHVATLSYLVAAPQAVFDLGVADTLGRTYTLGLDPSGQPYEKVDIYLNGVRLINGDDFTVDIAANTVTFTQPVPTNATVLVDVLIPEDGLKAPFNVVDTAAQVPAAGAGTGDAYYVHDTSVLYVWDDTNAPWNTLYGIVREAADDATVVTLTGAPGAIAWSQAEQHLWVFDTVLNDWVQATADGGGAILVVNDDAARIAVDTTVLADGQMLYQRDRKALFILANGAWAATGGAVSAPTDQTMLQELKWQPGVSDPAAGPDWVDARTDFAVVDTTADLSDRTTLPAGYLAEGKLVYVKDEQRVYQLLVDSANLTDTIDDWQPLLSGVTYVGRTRDLPTTAVDGQLFIIRQDFGGKDLYRLLSWDASIPASHTYVPISQLTYQVTPTNIGGGVRVSPPDVVEFQFILPPNSAIGQTGTVGFRVFWDENGATVS